MCKFHRRTPVLKSAFDKIAALKACNFIKKWLQQRRFRVKLCELFEEHLSWRTSVNGCFSVLRWGFKFEKSFMMLETFYWVKYPKNFTGKSRKYIQTKINLSRSRNKKPRNGELQKICENTIFHWPVFSRIRTESTFLSLYGIIWISENPYSRIFYAAREPTFGRCFMLKLNKLPVHRYLILWSNIFCILNKL